MTLQEARMFVGFPVVPSGGEAATVTAVEPSGTGLLFRLASGAAIPPDLVDWEQTDALHERMARAGTLKEAPGP